MIILQGQNLSRLFGSEVLFEKANLTIQHNSRIALVGKNGSGKSTLLKIILDIEKSDSGHISKNKDLKIGYLSQHPTLNEDNTIYFEMLDIFKDTLALHKQLEHYSHQLSDEKVLNNPTRYKETLDNLSTIQHEIEQCDGYAIESKIKMVLHGFKFHEKDYHTKISSLSGGQKTRLSLAKMLLENNDLLILDEPTNHLDIDTLNWLENYLTGYKGALLIVSHDRYFLDKVCQEVYELSQNTLHYYKGNYSYYVNEKQNRLEHALKEYEKQQVEIAKLEDFVAKNLVRASTTKRAQSRRKQLEKMVRLPKPIKDDKKASFQFVAEQESGNIVLETNDLAIGYDDTVLSQHIHLKIQKQEAIALIGDNGVGKSTLFKTLLNHIPSLHGSFKLGANVSIGYYDQEQKNLTPSKSILQELWDTFPTINEKDIRSILGSFLFSKDDVLKPISALSGGEKARVLLAKLSLEHNNFLILDEPTNHLDLDSKEVLEDTLIDYNGTLLFISHDRYFINKIATKIIEIKDNQFIEYIGDYNYYLEKRQQAIIEKNNNQTISSTQQQRIDNKETQKQIRQLERKIETLEVEMEQLEQQIKATEYQLTLPEIFSHHEQAFALHEQIESEKTQLSALLQQWEDSSIQLETIQSKNK